MTLILASFVLLLSGQLPEKPVRLNLPALTAYSSLANSRSVELPVKGAKATVLVFAFADCPIANRYVPELNRLAQSFAGRQVRFFHVYAETQERIPEARRHFREFKIGYPALADAKCYAQKALGMTVSPECAVLDAKGVLRYRGRIDDVNTGHGTRKPKVERHDLKIALDELLAGKPITEEETTAIGCFLNPP